MVCPILFETNCKNRDDRCYECLAVTSVGKLYYLPLVKLKEDHPCKDLTAVNRGKECNKRGRKVEANLIKDFGLKATEASGAKFRDGDGRLLLPNGDDIKISIKSRTGKNKLAITPDEYLIDQIHLINSKEYGTVIIMSKLVFDQLEQGYVRHEQELGLNLNS
jgi:hypothetical protein